MVAQSGTASKPKLDLIWTHTISWCCCYMCRWTEPVDLPFLRTQTKHDWSLAPAQSHVDSDRYDMAAQCGAGGKLKLDLIRTHTRLWCCCYMCRWTEPVDFPLLLSQTKHNWSLAPAQAHVDSDRHVMVAQCGACGKLKLDLIWTHTRLPLRTNASSPPEPVDLPLLLSQTKYNWSLAPAHSHVDDDRYVLAAQCVAGGKP
jgi:hypothetical protein